MLLGANATVAVYTFPRSTEDCIVFRECDATLVASICGRFCDISDEPRELHIDGRQRSCEYEAICCFDCNVQEGQHVIMFAGGVGNPCGTENKILEIVQITYFYGFGMQPDHMCLVLEEICDCQEFDWEAFCG